MKNISFLFLFLWAFANTSSGQGADCLENNFQTETIQVWNWTAKDTANEWMAYLKNGQVVIYTNIGSPFWPSTLSGNGNVAHLQFYNDSIKKDFLPEDGWELLKRDFGYNPTLHTSMIS